MNTGLKHEPLSTVHDSVVRESDGQAQVAVDSVLSSQVSTSDRERRSFPLQDPPDEPPDMHFRVDLEIFRGPLDLLLYLVRKHEVAISDVSISRITNQFIEHIEVLEQLDVNQVGDFIEMAGILIEIKSKMVLPGADEEDEKLEDPREELVQQLLEYKQYKDAAGMLEERGRNWQQCYTRQSNDLPPRDIAAADQPLHEIELWDLVSAFGRVMRAHERVKPCNIVYDDTPISVHMQAIHRRLLSDGQLAFSDMFEPGMHKSKMVGVFLAVLELVRHHKLDAEQNDMHGEIYLLAGEDFPDELRIDGVDDYDGRGVNSGGIVDNDANIEKVGNVENHESDSKQVEPTVAAVKPR